MAQQTAVEWLFEKMAQTPMTNWYEVRIQALYMEKEQIINAFTDGEKCTLWEKVEFFKERAEQYYKETYEKNSTHN